MSVDKTPTGVVYTVTNGTAGQQYPLTFPYIKGADVKAYYVANGKQTVLTYGIQYTVEDQGLTTLVALPVGAKLAIYRQTDLTQEIVWKDGQAVYTPDIMKADDKLTLIAQEIAADMSRTVKLTREEEAAGGKPEGVMQNIYCARDAAAASANIASNKAAEAADCAQMASGKAEESAASAAAAEQSAANAYAASEGIAPRMDAAETKNTQQDARLDAAEQGITAISTTLIGSIMSVMAADSYVPNGAVPADGAEYTREQFREFYDTYLAGGKLLTCPYAAFAAQVALTGNCAKFALDITAQKFKVPLLKDGDSITQASSAAELGKSYKAGLPNITGSTLGFQAITGAYGAGALYSTGSGGIGFGQSSGGGWNSIGLDASRSSPIYGNSTTVTDEQVRLRHFVVLASVQNSTSVFDWSNYMAGLAGKANLDMDNLTAAGSAKIAGYGKPSGRSISMTFPAYGNFSAPAPASGFVKAGGSSTAAGQWLRISKMPGYTSDDLRYSSLAGQWLIVTLPVRKGDTVFVDGNVPNSLALTFIYDAGAD